MRKVSGLIFSAFIFFILISCQYNTRQLPTLTPRQYNVTASVPTEESSATSTSVPTQTIVPMPTIMVPRLDIKSESIFIGTDIGRYYVYNIETKLTDAILLSAKCMLFRDGKKAICQNSAGVYIYELVPGKAQALPISKDSWELTPDRSALYYIRKNGDVSDLFTYNISTGAIVKFASINYNEWAVPSKPAGYWALFPEPSTYGKPTGVYVDTKGSPIVYYMVEVDTQTNVISRFSADITGYITGDMTLSPYAPIIGVGSTSKFPTDVTRCTATIFSTYNTVSRKVKQLLQAPEGECFDHFNLYSSNIWSPDGNKVILSTAKHICVLRMEESIGNCYEFNYSEEYINRISWSPDSQRIAFIVGKRSSAIQYLRISPVDDLSHVDVNESYNIIGPVVDLLWINP